MPVIGARAAPCAWILARGAAAKPQAGRQWHWQPKRAAHHNRVGLLVAQRPCFQALSGRSQAYLFCTSSAPAVCQLVCLSTCAASRSQHTGAANQPSNQPCSPRGAQGADLALP